MCDWRAGDLTCICDLRVPLFLFPFPRSHLGSAALSAIAALRSSALLSSALHCTALRCVADQCWFPFRPLSRSNNQTVNHSLSHSPSCALSIFASLSYYTSSIPFSLSPSLSHSPLHRNTQIEQDTLHSFPSVPARQVIRLDTSAVQPLPAHASLTHTSCTRRQLGVLNSFSIGISISRRVAAPSPASASRATIINHAPALLLHPSDLLLHSRTTLGATCPC